MHYLFLSSSNYINKQVWQHPWVAKLNIATELDADGAIWVDVLWSEESSHLSLITAEKNKFPLGSLMPQEHYR